MHRFGPSLLGLLAVCACSASAAAPTDFNSLGIYCSFTPMLDGIYCSGQPSREQFANLPKVGIQRVVTLRLPTEQGTGWEEELGASLGIDVLRIPIASKTGITVESARQLATALEGTGPVLVACGSSNRVGALFAMKAHFIDGKTADEALALGKSCGLEKLEPVVREKLGQ